MASRSMCQQFFLNVEDMEDFHVPGGRAVIESDFLNLCLASRDPIYPDIASSFWASCSFSAQNGFSGQLFGRRIGLTRAGISQYLDVEDIQWLMFRESWKDNLDEDEISELVYRYDILSPSRKLQYENLNKPSKFLHHIVTHVICPREDNFEVVTNKDLYIIYSLLHRDEINPVDIIYNHLVSAFLNPQQAIPYGFLVIMLLKELHLTPSDAWLPLRSIPSHEIGISYLSSKGLLIEFNEEFMDSDNEE